jgi:hypothetical protein
MDRQRGAYQGPLPGLSANGEYVTIIYVGTISLGGNLRLADGHSCDRNGRADGLLARRTRAPAAARSRTVRAPPRLRRPGHGRKGPDGRYGAGPAPGPAHGPERPGRRLRGGPAPGRDAQGATETPAAPASPARPDRNSPNDPNGQHLPRDGGA